MMFHLSKDKITGAKEYIIKAIQRQIVFEEFWALKNISFEVNKSEVFGVMGLNGAGKSTLLKIIAGVLRPTLGSVALQGNVAPLLELGAGFDHEYSARENIFMNGAMFGYSPKHMETKYEEILDFAELKEFEDVAIKNFSSGMVARLGFAVATSVNPEILIADEILGVGDFKFQNKCRERIEGMIERGTTVLLVSHSADTIEQMCSRAVLLDKGELMCAGSAKEVSDKYRNG